MTHVQLVADLPATRTHKRRYYQLTAPAGEWLFRLMIAQGKKHDVYFMDVFTDPELPPGFRAAYFSRQTGEVTDDRPSVYRVAIDREGRPTHCDCKASVCQVQTSADPEERESCKHKDVIRDMAERGLIPETAADPDQVTVRIA
jgi:hypothetical protein